MKTTCLVNNYNYHRFVALAVDSALEQTVPFDEIIVVDDGSTDGSAELLRDRYAGHERVTIYAKPNQGQLSCFNEGYRLAAGDIIFFLDADDLYEPTYLDKALQVYEWAPECDCLLAGERRFGCVTDKRPDGPDLDLGCSVLAAWHLRSWLGAPTSCLSMRRRLLERVLPVPFLEDWRVRADDCLVFGASLAGGRKFRLGERLVRYRIHDRQNFTGRGYDRFADYRRKLAVNRLFELYRLRLGYDFERLAEFAHREFRTIARPGLVQLLDYLRIAWRAPAGVLRRLSMAGSMLGHFLATRLGALAQAGQADFRRSVQTSRWNSSQRPISSS